MTPPRRENNGEAEAPFQSLTPDAALERLRSSMHGLETEEAARRLAREGPNSLPRPRKRGPFAIILRQFANPLVVLLIAAASVSLLIEEPADALFISAVLLFNALVGAFQEWKAERSAEALDHYLGTIARVRRPSDSGHTLIRQPASQLVPGDVVEVEGGDAVPADIRLLFAQTLAADESLLTGESEPTSKDAQHQSAAECGLADQRGMIFAGSTIDRGRAVGLVTATGTKTAIGGISKSLHSPDLSDPPLVVRVRHFTRRLSILSLLAVSAIGFAAYSRGTALEEVFVTAVALAVAAIPEGLPIAITVALSIASRRMVARHVIVRSLPAVEGLGACTLIASDKTGTLTQNKLTVVQLFSPLDGSWDSAIDIDTSSPGKARLLEAACLCNDAEIGPNGPVGDSVDCAFLMAARRSGLERAKMALEHPRLAEIPYEPAKRFQATLHDDAKGGYLACVKGAAETVLPLCADSSEEMLQLAASWAAEGLRVIAVAQGQVPREALEKGEPPQSLKFLGFAGISDPLRPDAPLAVQRCQQAGIEVRLVTGDHPKTALAVASDLGIAQHPNQVLTGTELREAGESAAALIARAQVFARVEPMQKLQIVETLRETGHFVAVTGDGVNDAPALRAANVGVAMGQAGTDVARAAADLIITDDNFASIVNGIEEGRIAYNNVRRVTLLLLATGFGEIVLFLLTLVANLPLPLFAVQLLWLNLVTNGIQDIALAFERSDRDVLKQKPRPPEEALFDGRMAEQVLLAGLYMGVATFFVFQQAIAQGWSEAEARTTALLMMVLFENVQALNSRSERVSILRLPLRDNPVLISSILLALGLHLASAWIPGLGSTLGIVQPTWYMIVSVLPLALGLVVVMELYKRLRGRIL